MKILTLAIATAILSPAKWTTDVIKQSGAVQTTRTATINYPVFDKVEGQVMKIAKLTTVSKVIRQRTLVERSCKLFVELDGVGADHVILGGYPLTKVSPTNFMAHESAFACQYAPTILTIESPNVSGIIDISI